MRSIKCDEIKRSALKEKFINKWDRRGREGSEERGGRKRPRKNIKRGVEGETGGGVGAWDLGQFQLTGLVGKLDAVPWKTVTIWSRLAMPANTSDTITFKRAKAREGGERAE